MLGSMPPEITACKHTVQLYTAWLQSASTSQVRMFAAQPLKGTLIALQKMTDMPSGLLLASVFCWDTTVAAHVLVLTLQVQP